MLILIAVMLALLDANAIGRFLGAGVLQIATFVSSLMMVGVVTLPMEIAHFGRRTALLRNAFAFAFSILAAFFVAGAVSL